MKSFIGLTKRNILVFLKDRQAVIFSLLTSIIVFVLYLLFLKGNYVNAITSSLDAMGPLKDKVDENDINMFVNLILLVGILGSAMITVPYNCLTTFVKDRENKIDYDILATPIRRWQVIFSYFLAAVISAIVLTGIILSVGLLILSAQGDLHMSGESIVMAYLTVALGSVSGTALFMILMLFFHSSQASGAFFGMLSAASGFVIGAYIPLSEFSEGIQSVCYLFPGSQVTTLLRSKLLTGCLDAMENSLEGMDGGMFATTMKEIFSFETKLFHHSLNAGGMVLYVLAAIVLCLLVQIVLYAKNYKRK